MSLRTSLYYRKVTMKSYFALSGCVFPLIFLLLWNWVFNSIWHIFSLQTVCFAGCGHAYLTAELSTLVVIKYNITNQWEKTIKCLSSTWAQPCLSQSRGLANNTFPTSKKHVSFCSFKYVFELHILFFLYPDLRTPSLHTNSFWWQSLGSIILISWENSRSVITLSQPIKLLPRSDRWQMLEGLFIFCLLIRAARIGGGVEKGRTEGVRERYKRKRRQKGIKGRREHLTANEATTFTYNSAHSPCARVHVRSLTLLMWEISD